ncbi:tripartite tricarboxylate transporter TctB family protein [Shouchella tritolerans]|uniref:tripartite tricarboxylate transporter TctB family protein n=1 Tax=Shouchella tritolerans TaxID=2979466 RepID=UPI0021E7D568|nr:tripartite tricarboxylate transporter TctB family protein [Shouchella tritolerans]
MSKLDCWIGMGTLIVGAYIILETLTMDYMRLMDDPGPVLLPRIVGTALVICGAALTVGGLKAKKKTEPKEDLPEAKARQKKMYVILGSLFLYAVAFSALGYVLSTFLFLAATTLYLSSKRTKKHVVQVTVASLLITFSIYWIFTEYLDVLLPGGFFR